MRKRKSRKTRKRRKRKKTTMTTTKRERRVRRRKKKVWLNYFILNFQIDVHQSSMTVLFECPCSTYLHQF